MIDIRYHVYSLAAVFLALAIGIMVGTSFANSHPSATSGHNTIARYERDMHTLRSEILKASDTAAKKEATVKALQDYCRAMMPSVVKNKLYWRNVAVIQTGDSDDLTGSVKRALELAGAQVTCTVDISSAFPFSDNAKVSDAMTNSGLGVSYGTADNGQRLLRIVTETVCSGKYSYFVPKLEKAGVAKFSGSCDTACGLVVLVGGASALAPSLAQDVDSQLVPDLKAYGVTVVGCEASTASVSYIPVWHKCGIATIDNADDAMGQTSLIYALNGELANFGTKDTADRLIPKALEGQ